MSGCWFARVGWEEQQHARFRPVPLMRTYSGASQGPKCVHSSSRCVAMPLMLSRTVYTTRCIRCEQYCSTRARVHAFVVTLRTNAFDAFPPLREPHRKVYAEEFFPFFFLFFWDKVCASWGVS